jgi:formylglycine-generating enzyme
MIHLEVLFLCGRGLLNRIGITKVRDPLFLGRKLMIDRALLRGIALVVFMCCPVVADTIHIETVLVGDSNNAADTATGYGAVNRAFRIGTYEVTAGQYTEFLNAKGASNSYGLYNDKMWDDSFGMGCKIQQNGPVGNYTYSVASDYANRPVNYVSFWDAARFVNWMHNGQGTGDTETGAYTLNGYNGEDGREIARNPGAKWFLPSEDEWYKAAYYKAGSINAGYWKYPTASNDTPSNLLVDPTDPGNNATWWDNEYTIGSPYYRTVYGAHENSKSAYLTFDQGGNVWEWNDTVAATGEGYSSRGIRGGSYGVYASFMESTTRDLDGPSYEYASGGFRVATTPEPGSLVLLIGFALTAMLCWWRKRA